MSRLQACFQALKSSGGKALIPYVTAGDPNPEVTVPLMHGMVKAGANVIELGVPFSDPMADGPVIQKATERALAHHVSLLDTMQMVRRFRVDDANTPVVLMGYLNPVEVMGYQAFADAAADSGVDGVLTVDLPPEEAMDLAGSLRARQLDPIFLLAPTSNQTRIRLITGQASGFVYYVSLKGVTGSKRLDIDEVAGRLQEIRALSDLPLGVGFGISDAESAASVARVADAVVVGSALVKKIEENPGDPAKATQLITDLLAQMRSAMDQV